MLPAEGPRLSERKGTWGGRCTGIEHKGNFCERRTLNERNSPHLLGKDRGNTENKEMKLNLMFEKLEQTTFGIFLLETKKL